MKPTLLAAMLLFTGATMFALPGCEVHDHDRVSYDHGHDYDHHDYDHRDYHDDHHEAEVRW